MDSLEKHSEGWTLSIGTTPGYALADQKPMLPGEFAEIYKMTAGEIFTETGVYISAVQREVRMLYNGEWGCPEGGEFGYELHGVWNPQFSGHDAYFDALRKLTLKLKQNLRQSAVYLETYPIELSYITGEAENE